MMLFGLLLVLLTILAAAGALVWVAYSRRYRAEAARPKAEAFAEERRLREQNERRPDGQ